MLINEEILNITKYLGEIANQKCDEYKNMLISGEHNCKNVIEIVFIRNVIDDICFINNIKTKINNRRFIYLILRNCIEQIIIFKFLNARYKKDSKIFEDYMGYNATYETINFDSGEKFFENIKELYGKRTKKYNNKFYDMAKEFENSSDEITLYKFYGYLSDLCHNSYYEDVCNFMLDEKKIDYKEIQGFILLALQSLLGEFR